MILILCIVLLAASLNVCFAEDNISSSPADSEKSMLLISDNGGTNILDSATKDVSDNYSNVNIQVRSCDQVYSMKEDEIYDLVNKSDIVIVNWLTSDADSVLTNILNKDPNLSNKELFLILQTSATSKLESFNLVKHSTINYTKILDNSIYTDDVLNEYFTQTKRGLNYNDVYNYVTTGNGNKINTEFSKAVLYKNCNDKENQLNEILWALNLVGFNCQYAEPSFHQAYQYGIYRDRYLTLNQYKELYFNSSRKYTVGILESNMYVSSAALDPYYKIIESLESKGANVIPIVAAG